MKSILYTTHTAWSWIKQRPQFLAEGLSESFLVDVYYRKSNHAFKSLNPQSYKRGNLSVKGFRNIPWERIKSIPPKTLYQINRLLWLFKCVDINKYDYIWVTDPLIWWILKNKKIRGKIIYDCMDDLLAFPYYEKYPNVIPFTKREEEDLLKKADFLFFSAETLKEKLFQRYNLNREYYIINNAITEDICKYSESLDGIMLPENTFVYIGTISEWFDFELVIDVLKKHHNIQVYLFGPIRMSNPPQHERLVYAGSIEHKRVLGVMMKAKALIMPFIVNDLILSVNPVKLYEYIYSGKPVISVKYPETEKFKSFICLYKNKEEFMAFVEDVLNGSIANNVSEMKSFSLANTWSSRCKDVVRILEKNA